MRFDVLGGHAFAQTHGTSRSSTCSASIRLRSEQDAMGAYAMVACRCHGFTYFCSCVFLFCGISMSRSCTSAASTGTRRSSASPSSSVAQIGATCQLKTLTLQKTASFPWLPQLHLFILPGRGVPHSSLAQLPGPSGRGVPPWLPLNSFSLVPVLLVTALEWWRRRRRRPRSWKQTWRTHSLALCSFKLRTI